MWNTNATESIPTPAMTQLMSMAPGAATEAMFWGREKIPAPTVEPMIKATSVHMGTERWLAPGWGWSFTWINLSDSGGGIKSGG